ncbi:T-cell surface glycoprotein CD3 epsilon chain-like [Onychostoma macrolepis]|uniref:T-cell surface glycoprotein CD3 epsilon chain n=1 Tax=Onychostoma macrolepis TaxID=369639 RepID=A0A7J6CB35_9TELE|nr:T-cell surface glycoprotein CD3 epsilon chain-like [Onychostoma macrolepis]KAF4104529.1 hypothetical protein G5714_015516 [Onychostoma macrolepis]
MLLLSVMIVMIVLLAAAVDPAQGQELQITGYSVILTCSGGEDGGVTWKKDDKAIDKENKMMYEVSAEQGIVKGSYFCEYSDVKHMFYLKVKVCENCYELSGTVAWGVIFGDLLITGLVILCVYTCAARNSDGTQKKASNPRSVNPPRPPNPDYEALDPKMRSSNALYAGLNK